MSSKLPRSALPLLGLLLLGACAHGPESIDAARGAGPPAKTEEGADRSPAPEVSGPNADHAAVLRARLRGIVLCYEELLKEDEALAGTFLATLDIAADGTLVETTLSSETQNPAKLEACVQRGLEGARFPASEEGYLIEVPLTFAPRVVEPEPPADDQAAAAPPTD